MTDEKKPKTTLSVKPSSQNLVSASGAVPELARQLKTPLSLSKQIQQLTVVTPVQQSIANALRDMDHKFAFDSPVTRLAEELRKNIAQFAALRLPTISLNTGIAKELARLQETLRVFQPDPKILSFGQQIADAVAAYQDQFKAISSVVSSAAEALSSFGEPFRLLAQDQAVAEFIIDLGFVPHGELWEHVADVEKPEGEDDFSENLIVEVWPKLRQRLELSIEECLGDPKLHRIFIQMLGSFDAGLCELTLTSVPTLLERAVLMARRSGDKTKTFEWIKAEVSDLPLEYVGGIRGYRVWKVLLDHTFAGVWTDADADAIKFPNRHASAHGMGSRLATKIDSVNAILLCHFVITIAKAVRDYRDDKLN